MPFTVIFARLKATVCKLILMLAMAVILPLGRASAIDLTWNNVFSTWNLTGGDYTFLTGIDGHTFPAKWGQDSSVVFQGTTTISMPDAGEYRVNVFSSIGPTFNAGADTSLTFGQFSGVSTFNSFKNVNITGSFIGLGYITFGGDNSNITFSSPDGIGLGAVEVKNGSAMSIGDNGIQQTAVTFSGYGGSLLVSTATAAGIQAGTVTMSGDATTLQITQGVGITEGTQTFSGSGSQLIAGSAGAVAGGNQVFTGSDSVFHVTTTGGVTGGVVRLERNALFSIEADHATTTGAVIFDNSLGGLGGIVGLNGHDTTLAYLGSAQAGAGLIRNGAATDATLTLAMTGTSGFTGVLADGAGGGKLNLNIAGSGTLYLGGIGTQTGTLSLSGGALVIDNDTNLGASSAVLQFNGGTLATTASVTLNRTVSVGSGGGIFNVGSGQTASIQNLIGTGTLTKRGGTFTLTGDSAFDGSLKIAESDFQVASGVSLALGNGTDRSVLTGTIGTSGTLAFNAVDSAAAISGTGALVKSGSGRAILTGDTAHTGGTTILGGDLQIGNFGTTSGSLSGNVVNQGTLTFARDNADVTFAGAISGTGRVEQLGGKVLTLSGNNSYTGDTGLEAGTLRLGSAQALGSGGAIHFDGGILQYSAANETDYSSRFSQEAGQQYKIDTGGQQVTLASALSSAGGSLTKSGDGQLTLSGSNGYDGGTWITGGVLSVAGDANLGAVSGTLVFDNGTLRTTGNMDTTRAITLASGGGTFDVANETFLTIENTLSGGGGLSKIGTGFLTLVGVQTYAGPTTVQGGFFKIESGSLASSSVNLSAAAFLLSNSTGELSAQITGSGTFARGGAGASIITGTVGQGILTRIDSGTLQIGKGPNGGAVLGDVVNNGTLSVNQEDYIYDGSISGTGTVTNVGSGTFTLSGSSSFGTLSPNEGTIQITGRVTSSQTSGIGTTGTTATLLVNGSGASWTSQADTLLGLNGGTGNLLIGNGATVSDTFSLVGRTAGSTGHVTVSDSIWTHSAGLVIGMGGVGSMDIIGGKVSNAGGTIGGEIGSSGTVRVSGSTALWSSSSYLIVGNSGTGVLTVDRGGTVQVGPTGSGTITLGNSGSASGTLNIGGRLSQSSNVGGVIAAGEITGGSGSGAKIVNFNYLTETNYVFAPRLTGSLSVVHRQGDTTLTGSNTYTGGTVLAGGTLTISADTNLGATSGTLTLSGPGTLHVTGTVNMARSVALSSSLGTINVDDQASLTLSGTASGFGGLTKTGSGHLTLAAQNTYTGDTDIQGGLLSVNGSIAGNAIVHDGATLGGSGRIHGNVTLQAGGILGPGNSPGLLTIDGNLTLNAQSILQMEFGGTSLYDQLSVRHPFTAVGTLNLVILDDYAPEIGDTFTIFTDATPILNGGNFSITSNLAEGLYWDTSRLSSGGTVTVVPEPSTWALWGVGLLLLAMRWRRVKAG